MKALQFNRRVSKREFASALNIGATWFDKLSKDGRIPPGRRDPGGIRLWWPASEVEATLAKMLREAEVIDRRAST